MPAPEDVPSGDAAPGADLESVDEANDAEEAVLNNEATGRDTYSDGYVDYESDVN